MDDFLSGQNTIPEALLLRDQVIEILEQGKFKLRKWASNEPRLLPAVSESLDSVLINLDKNGDIKTLGLTWNYRDDILKYVTTELPIANRKFTKRSILSKIAKIYDPLG